MHAESRAQSAEQALRELGVRCVLEARGTLAVVIPAPGERTLEDASRRRAVLAALRPYGFTHVAVELEDEPMPVATHHGPNA